MLFIDDKLVPNDVHSKMFGCTVLSEDRNIRKRKLWQKQQKEKTFNWNPD